MKKSVLITLIVLAIFIIVDIFLWWNYQNIQKISKPTNANLNIPITELNENINIVPATPLTQLEQTKNIIKSIIEESDTIAPASPSEISDKIMNSSPNKENIELALISIADEQDIRNKFIAFQNLFLLETDKTIKSPIALNALKSYLADPDFQVSFLAAEYLVLLEDKNGFPVIIEGLKHDETSLYSEPRTTISNEALILLLEETGLDFGYDYDKWMDWWLEKQSTLQWDAQTQSFK